MRLFPFVYCLVIAASLVALYTFEHNRLTQARMRVIALEKELKLQEAQCHRLELEMAIFTSPVRLEELARQARYSHFHAPRSDEVIELQ